MRYRYYGMNVFYWGAFVEVKFDADSDKTWYAVLRQVNTGNLVAMLNRHTFDNMLDDGSLVPSS